MKTIEKPKVKFKDMKKGEKVKFIVKWISNGLMIIIGMMFIVILIYGAIPKKETTASAESNKEARVITEISRGTIYGLEERTTIKFYTTTPESVNYVHSQIMVNNGLFIIKNSSLGTDQPIIKFELGLYKDKSAQSYIRMQFGEGDNYQLFTIDYMSQEGNYITANVTRYYDFDTYLIFQNTRWIENPSTTQEKTIWNAILKSVLVEKNDYNQGYNAGYLYGYNQGSDSGYNIGYDNGYQIGYNKGIESAEADFNPIGIIIKPVAELLEIKIFGNFSIGAFLSVGLFVSIALIFLKMFAGG